MFIGKLFVGSCGFEIVTVALRCYSKSLDRLSRERLRVGQAQSRANVYMSLLWWQYGWASTTAFYHERGQNVLGVSQGQTPYEHCTIHSGNSSKHKGNDCTVLVPIIEMHILMTALLVTTLGHSPTHTISNKVTNEDAFPSTVLLCPSSTRREYHGNQRLPLSGQPTQHCRPPPRSVPIGHKDLDWTRDYARRAFLFGRIVLPRAGLSQSIL